MSVYKYLEYRNALQEIVSSRRELPGKFTLRKLANASGLQASFLTNVLKGRFDFSSDQLFALTTELGLSDREREYLLLLLEFERSIHPPRRKQLKQQIDRIRKENLESEKHLNVQVVERGTEVQAQYYLDPFAQLALVFLNLAAYAKNPEKLGAALGISQVHLGGILQILGKLGYVRLEGTTYKVMAHNHHLPKRNPLSGPHLTLMRLKSLDQIQRLAVDQGYSHAVTLTGTDETKDALSEAYLNFLKLAEAIVKPAKSERVFQMNFDLFPWDLG